MSSNEIVSIVDALSRDKGIPKEQLLVDVEKAIEDVGKRKYGSANMIKAKLDRRTGEIMLFRVLLVVDQVQDYMNEISLADAQKQQPGVVIGDSYHDMLPPIDLGRSEAMMVRTSINSSVKKAERQREYEEFLGKVGQLIIGVVKRVEYGHIIIDLGRAEGLLKKDQLTFSDRFKIGDRVRSYIYDVRREDFGSQIFLSRTHEQMIAKLFEIEVPEISDGIVKIKAIARDAGSKSKIAVFGIDSGVDPVAACVGMRGTRVKSIMAELGGEKIDVFAWHIDSGKYLLNALGLSSTSAKVIIDHATKKATVLVNPEDLSSAIGRGGQNVKLASKITQLNIEVLTEEVQSKRRLDEFYNVSGQLIEELDLDETLAQFLVAKGFNSVAQIANTPHEDLLQIEGFDEELATELLDRAKEICNTNNEQIFKKFEQLGVEQDLIDMLNFISFDYLLIMAQKGIKSIEDLASCSPDDIKKMVPDIALSQEDMLAIIDEAKAKIAH